MIESIIPGCFYIHKSLCFWKVTTLGSVLISNSCTLQDIIIFHGHPTSHDSPSQTREVATLPTHRIDAYVSTRPTAFLQLSLLLLFLFFFSSPQFQRS